MKTLNYQVQLKFSQIVQIVRQLSINEKIKLSKELEKDAVNSTLSRLLKSFKTNDLTEDVIAEESDFVRKSLYQKSHGI
ncbi:MAG: hypothetical protein M0Q53_07795 [Prolixibacteraceae bacterium]|jgi:hypothetical protein|nr:hypothetical protein [Prolixibacteraceae bacterium]